MSSRVETRFAARLRPDARIEKATLNPDPLAELPCSSVLNRIRLTELVIRRNSIIQYVTGGRSVACRSAGFNLCRTGCSRYSVVALWQVEDDTMRDEIVEGRGQSTGADRGQLRAIDANFVR